MTLLLINNTSIALSNYNQSLATRNLQNDQYQAYALSSRLAARITEFCATIGFPFASKGLLAVFGVSMAIANAATYLKPSDKEPLNCSPSQMVGRVSYHLLQRGDLILNTAFAVHYIYQLTLGVQLAPLVGITTLALLVLKNYALLPHSIEKRLLTISAYCNLVSVLTYPQFSVIHTGNIILTLYLFIFFQLFKKEEDYLQGEHTVTPLRELPPSEFEAEINPDYIFNKEVGNLFPLDASSVPTRQDFELLFEQLEKNGCLNRIEDKTGWEYLKAGLIQECFRGTPPGNMPLFKQLMHAILKSTAENSLDRDSIVKELNDIGNQCTDGWTRELTFMYHPKSKDIGWAVHRVFAEYRGHRLQEVVQEELRKDETIKLLGGENNIHLINAYHFAARHQIRTLQGEVEFKKQPVPTVNGILKWGLYSQYENIATTTGCVLFMLKLKDFNPLVATTLYIDLNEKIVPIMKFELFQSPLSSHMHELILERAILEEKIEWQAFASWLRDLHSRVAPNEEIGTFFQRFEERSDRPMLNHEGIRLLLLDLNITRLARRA